MNKKWPILSSKGFRRLNSFVSNTVSTKKPKNNPVKEEIPQHKKSWFSSFRDWAYGVYDNSGKLFVTTMFLLALYGRAATMTEGEYHKFCDDRNFFNGNYKKTFNDGKGKNIIKKGYYDPKKQPPACTGITFSNVKSHPNNSIHLAIQNKKITKKEIPKLVQQWSRGKNTESKERLLADVLRYAPQESLFHWAKSLVKEGVKGKGDFEDPNSSLRLALKRKDAEVVKLFDKDLSISKIDAVLGTKDVNLLEYFLKKESHMSLSLWFDVATKIAKTKNKQLIKACFNILIKGNPEKSLEIIEFKKLGTVLGIDSSIKSDLLNIAINNNNWGVVNYFLIKKFPQNPNNPIFTAKNMKKMKAQDIKMLSKSAAKIDPKTVKEQLSIAIKKGYWEFVVAVLEQKVPFKFKHSLIEYATYYRAKFDVIEKLMKLGVAWDQSDFNRALRSDRYDIAGVLLKAGAKEGDESLVLNSLSLDWFFINHLKYYHPGIYSKNSLIQFLLKNNARSDGLLDAAYEKGFWRISEIALNCGVKPTNALLEKALNKKSNNIRYAYYIAALIKSVDSLSIKQAEKALEIFLDHRHWDKAVGLLEKELLNEQKLHWATLKVLIEKKDPVDIISKALKLINNIDSQKKQDLLQLDSVVKLILPIR